jgi:glutamate-1-semialdehyde aminotransferase
MFDPAIYHRSLHVIAQGALTNSKRPESFVFGEYPTHLTRGDGCFLYDLKSNKYLDYICSLGVNLLGHNNSTIFQAITKAYHEGTVLSLSSVAEVDYGEKIKGLFNVDRIRIFKTGSEACHAALRIARSYNGKGFVLSEGYHGWNEEFVSLTPPAVGCANNFKIIKFESMDQLAAYDVGTIIIEPIITDYSEGRIEFLKKLRDECTRKNIVLIFDETITGCRFPKLSVSKYLGIDPDILILGKAIGGGLPLSIVGGKKEIMESGDYFTSSTFSGDRLAMAASTAFLNILTRDGITKLWDSGENFIEQFNSLSSILKIEGYPTRGIFKGNDIIKALFFQEAIRAKILFGPSWFFSFPLREHTFSTISTCKDILTRIESGQVKLIGKIPKSPFSLRVRHE